MMRIALVLLCCFLTSSCAYDILCSTPHIGRIFVDAVVGRNPVFPATSFNTSFLIGAENALHALYDYVNYVTPGAFSGEARFGGLGVGMNFGDFYGIVKCNPNVYACPAGSLMYAARNGVAYGDSLVHFFAIGVNGAIGTAYAGPSGYSVDTSEWFTANDNDWTRAPVLERLFGDNSGAAWFPFRYSKQLSNPVPYPYSRFVAVAWRLATDPCVSCLNADYPPLVQIRTAVPDAPAPGYVGSNFARVQDQVDFLQPLLTANTRSCGTGGFLYVKTQYPEGESYAVWNCALCAGEYTECQTDRSTGQPQRVTTGYQVWITSLDLFGNLTQMVFALASDGSVGHFVGFGDSNLDQNYPDVTFLAQNGIPDADVSYSRFVVATADVTVNNPVLVGMSRNSILASSFCSGATPRTAPAGASWRTGSLIGLAMLVAVALSIGM